VKMMKLNVNEICSAISRKLLEYLNVQKSNITSFQDINALQEQTPAIELQVLGLKSFFDHNGLTIKRKMKDGSGKFRKMTSLYNTIVPAQFGCVTYVLKNFSIGAVQWQLTMNASIAKGIEIIYVSKKRKLIDAPRAQTWCST